MDLSALIFVALAVAWTAYLIPKALRHHEVDRASRTVESFSGRMRVLARRDAVSAERAELVVDRSRRTRSVTADDPLIEPARVEGDAVAPTPTPSPTPTRTVAHRAARRRRRVLGLVLLVLAVVTGLAIAGIVAWAWIAAPAGLLVAWLVACRLMVRRERSPRRRVRASRGVPAVEDDVAIAEDDTVESPASAADAPASPEPGQWDPVPVTLPTYVAKAPAGRTVRTINLDATGVWSSGRNAADSALARAAAEQERAAVDQPVEPRRVSGG